jgi:hypothetical protein
MSVFDRLVLKSRFARAIKVGWLWLHESGIYEVHPAVAKLFA